MTDEHYGKILHSFWTDPRIKRKLSRDGKLLLAYYFSSPHKNMSGVYYCPIPYASDETGVDPETIRGLLPSLKDFLTFDPDTDEVFVHGMAETAIGDELKAGDTKRRHLERHLAAAHSTRLRHLFQQRYAHWGVKVTIPEQRTTPSGTPSDTPSDTRAVKEQSQAEPSVLTEPASRSADDPTDGQIMAAIREHLYAPDGIPPEGWSEGREFSVMRSLRKLGKSGSQIRNVVEGLGCLLRDERVDWLRGKATLRAVFNSRSGVLDMWGQAEDAYYKQGNTFGKRPKSRPEDIRAAIQRELAQAKRGA